VNLALPNDGLDAYHSKSQRARVATEQWGADSLFCMNCDSPTITRSRHGTPVIDYVCPRCEAPFQLKSQSKPLAARIVDAAYSAMKRAIDLDQTPNLFVMHYEPGEWLVRNLLLIPKFAFSLAALEKRKPLASTARRAGWVGCNIVLANIPPDARISIITEGRSRSPRAVREQYKKLRPLAKLQVGQRGWTLDTLNAIRSFGTNEFTLSEAYSLEPALAALHPDNHHVREKIRQQLQVLRDLGLLEFLGDGNYRLR